jgi:hypothetical protein
MRATTWVVLLVGLGVAFPGLSALGQDAVVPQAPPPPRVESPGPPPSPGAIWIAGYWTWSGAQFVWQPGRWETPQPGAAWVPGRWKKTGEGWVWEPGRWRR